MPSWRVSGQAKAVERDSTEQESRPRPHGSTWSRDGAPRSRVRLLDSLFEEPKLVFDDEAANQQRFLNYFTFGGVRRIKKHLSDNTVVRNRVVFIAINIALFGYVIISLVFG